MAKQSFPNRGYIFEAVWAASVAARFYKRFGKPERWKRMKETYNRIGLTQPIGKLPPINYSDVSLILTEIFSKRSRSLTKQTQHDVKWDVDVQDYLNVKIGVPANVDKLLKKYAKKRDFSEIRDFIRSSVALVNNHSTLNQKVKSVAFNGYTDSITVTADGLLSQRNVKADVTVTISTQDPKIKDIQPFAVSCKVPGGEQFAQVSGGEWEQFEKLFGEIGVIIPQNVKDNWYETMQEYLTEDIFKKKYATKQSINSTNIPTQLKNAAKNVYRSISNSMNSNFPKESFVSYVINGFSYGIDTEVVKLTGTSRGRGMIMTGGKTLKIDDTFRQLMLSLDYSTMYKETAQSAIIIVSANGIVKPIMQIRYKWENKSNKPTQDAPQKTYSIYPRHYLEVLDGMFFIDQRTQQVSV